MRQTGDGCAVTRRLGNYKEPSGPKGPVMGATATCAARTPLPNPCCRRQSSGGMNNPAKILLLSARVSASACSKSQL